MGQTGSSGICKAESMDEEDPGKEKEITTIYTWNFSIIVPCVTPILSC